MQLRSIEIITPKQLVEDIKKTLDDYNVYEVWEQTIGPQQKNIRFFADAEHCAKLLEYFDHDYSKIAGFRIIISAVEATIPALTDEELPQDPIELSLTQKNRFLPSPLITIPLQELYNSVSSATWLSTTTIILFVLSAVVAAIGLLESNVSIVIWSMVLAPFLWPNVGLALWTTLGDKVLIKKGVRSLLLWSLLVFSIAFVWWLLDSHVWSLMSLPGISYYLIIVAFVSGVAAILSIMSWTASALVGVMVAVALLPPLVLSGLLLGGGFWAASGNAFLLFAANIICLNLAGIIVFLLAGVKPMRRWEAAIAHKHTQRALSIWTILLALLILITYFLTH